MNYFLIVNNALCFKILYVLNRSLSKNLMNEMTEFCLFLIFVLTFLLIIKSYIISEPFIWFFSDVYASKYFLWINYHYKVHMLRPKHEVWPVCEVNKIPGQIPISRIFRILAGQSPKWPDIPGQWPKSWIKVVRYHWRANGGGEHSMLSDGFYYFYITWILWAIIL